MGGRRCCMLARSQPASLCSLRHSRILGGGTAVCSVSIIRSRAGVGFAGSTDVDMCRLDPASPQCSPLQVHGAEHLCRQCMAQVAEVRAQRLGSRGCGRQSWAWVHWHPTRVAAAHASCAWCGACEKSPLSWYQPALTLPSCKQPSPAGPSPPSPTPTLWRSIDEAEYEDPDKINQSPLTFEGFAPAVAFFVVSQAVPPPSMRGAPPSRFRLTKRGWSEGCSQPSPCGLLLHADALAC